MDNYQPNSHRSKEIKNEKKKVEKVINGTAKVKKKNKITKFADVFVAEDAASVKSYIFSDVLVPAVKKLICDIVEDGINMVMYGSTGGRRSSSSRSGYISYDKYSFRRDDRRSTGSTRTVNGYRYDDITVPTRGDAEKVLEQLDELIDNYGVAYVADLYDLVGITGNYTDNRYGWTNIRNAEPVRTREGDYILKMPKALPID